ncbi:ankyrin repeat family protein [Orientia chuto str. Dubai]|uniref:Ankyrin repeat family protein n=1 Tax=Orientia chuto str. Dubai TaxID=1359168 RepID=A0A0F3MIA1_9RICK|nr:ankyrin repeat domain-containing protein [Candidatus Orientia mediorientalis]KJV55386.1 ankyrin repeat family protein [Orientia chuto str. Dubai]
MYNLHEAVKCSNIEEVKRLLNEGNYDINELDEHSCTALHYATEARCPEIVELLLTHGSDANLADNMDNTPLHHAVEACCLEIIKLLLDYGANVDFQNSDHKTPLCYAIILGNTKVIDLLLDNGANINLVDPDNNTLLHNAVQDNDITIVKTLLRYGANINLQNNNGHTPLNIVCTKLTQNQKHYQKMAQLLVAYIVIGLELGNLDSNSAEVILNKSIIDEFKILNDLECQCKQEIEKMNNIQIGKNNLSLFHLLLIERKNITLLSKYVKHPSIASYQVEFPLCSAFLEESVNAAISRTKLLDGAIASVDDIFTSSSQTMTLGSATSWLHLSNEIKYMIMESLDNNDLALIQQTSEQLEVENVEVAGESSSFLTQ